VRAVACMRDCDHDYLASLYVQTTYTFLFGSLPAALIDS
jgi:predicted metal-binding protein